LVLRALLLSPEFALSVLTGMTAQFAMVMIMAALPLAMVNDKGYSFDRYAVTIQCHLLGMFVPGFFTGAILDCLGIFVVLVAGLALQSAAITVGSCGESPEHFLGALVILGVAWNFLSVGSTKLLLRSPATSSSNDSAGGGSGTGAGNASGGAGASSSSPSSDAGYWEEGETTRGGGGGGGGGYRPVHSEDEKEEEKEEKKEEEDHMHTLQAVYEFLIFAANAVGSWLAGYESNREGWYAVMRCAVPLTAASVLAALALRVVRPGVVGMPRRSGAGAWAGAGAGGGGDGGSRESKTGPGVRPKGTSKDGVVG
jgi:hypothetical protein